LGAAILLAGFVALRPSLLEYPVDHINYWQKLIESSGVGGADAQACDLGGPAIYIPYCTLWFKLAAASPISGAWLISGLFARLVHFGELFLLSLALVRFWVAQTVKPISAVCMLVLVFAGTGYLYDAFVINHALQGSIIAAALLVECASVLSWIFSRLRASCSQSNGGLVLVAAWYALSVFYLLLAVKLHGLFALLVLVWILIAPIVIVLLGSLPFAAYEMTRLPRLAFGGISLALFLILFAAKSAHDILIPSNFAGVVIRWSDLLDLGGPGGLWPVSFVPRTSDTRPEALAVLGWLAASLVIYLVQKDPSSRPASFAQNNWTYFRGSANLDFADYALLSSVYVLSILVAYLVPPFSNLFLKLNPDYSSHMRLMWGACLVSPLPCFLFGRGLRPLRLAALASMVVVLLPIQFVSGQRKQLFFSKSRHFLVPSPAWADPSQLAADVLPVLNRIQEADPGRHQLIVVADPLVRSALYPFGIATIPSSTVGSDRLFKFSQLPPGVQDDAASVTSIDSSAVLDQRPDVVIQQPVRDCFYSVYSDMAAYDPCIAARTTSFEVNRWSSALLHRHGYVLERTLVPSGLQIWRRR
jgi:hypothetical protein